MQREYWVNPFRPGQRVYKYQYSASKYAQEMANKKGHSIVIIERDGLKMISEYRVNPDPGKEK